VDNVGDMCIKDVLNISWTKGRGHKNGSKYRSSKSPLKDANVSYETSLRLKNQKLVSGSTRTHKQKVGKLGEDIACRYLVERGFWIIERNFWRKWGEIDIIASRKNLLHFIEVKTVSSDFGKDDGDSIDAYRPEENVHPRKLKRLARTVATYLAGRNDDPEWQFDVVVVFIDRDAKKARIRYLEDIVL